MTAPTRSLARTFLTKALNFSQIRPVRIFLMGLVAFSVMAQILVLSPKPLETVPGSTTVSPTELITSDDAVLATGIPENRIADYTIDGFQYVGTQNSQKQWIMRARRAFLYDEESLVHAVDVDADLYDVDGEITHVKGKEAKYYLNQRDLEVFGSVETRFPDGFVTKSEYMRYQPGERKITVPPSMIVQGTSEKGEKSERVDFTSRGLSYSMETNRVVLPKEVHFTLTSEKKTGPYRTSIDADQCEIDRENRIAHFSMDSDRKPESRYVQINEPSLYSRSRKAELNYSEAAHTITYLTTFEDVFVRERAEKTSYLRYATGGRAEFDRLKNQVILRDFPQVYQDRDTMTGDVIIMHRDTDVVEVEQSNAFSEGRKKNDSKTADGSR